MLRNRIIGFLVAVKHHTNSAIDRFVTVWRVENDDGAGPYNRGWSANSAWYKSKLYVEMVYDSYQGPGPLSDFNINDYYKLTHEHLFGFKSESQAKKWFGRWLKTLKMFGFNLVQKKADRENILEGSWQIAFIPA